MLSVGGYTNSLKNIIIVIISYYLLLITNRYYFYIFLELPTQRPIITGIHSRYRLGDVINGNCSSDYSKPAANLTWWINDIQVNYY